MQRQRFEFKYLLTEDQALGVREYVRTQLELDEASVDKPNNSYRVNSLYLDSDGLQTFWDWVNSNRNRFKLRMRYYDTNPESPVFLEIKRRVSACILKQRCGIRKSSAPFVLEGQSPPPEDILSEDAKKTVALSAFLGLVTRLHARPKAMVTYLREAYVDADNDDVRVTLDRKVRIAPCEEVDFSLNLMRYVQPFGQRVILELKFNNRFPLWFNEMIKLLGLVRGAAAKYCEGTASLQCPEHANWPTPPVEGPLIEPEAAKPMTREEMPEGGSGSNSAVAVPLGGCVTVPGISS